MERMELGWSLRALYWSSASMRAAMVRAKSTYWQARLRAVAPHIRPGRTERERFWQFVRWTSTHRATVGGSDERCVTVVNNDGAVVRMTVCHEELRHHHQSTLLYSEQAVRSVCSIDTDTSIMVTSHGGFVVLGTPRMVRRVSDGAAAALPLGRRYVQIFYAVDCMYVGWLDDRTVVGWHGNGTVWSELRDALGHVRFVQLSVGDRSVLGVCDDGTCCGYSAMAENEAVTGARHALPRGRTFVQVAIAERMAVGILDDGTLIRWGIVGLWHRTPFHVPRGRRCVQIACRGDCFVLGLLDDGTCIIWNLGDPVLHLIPPVGTRLVKMADPAWESLAAADAVGAPIGWDGEHWRCTQEQESQDG